MVEISSGNTMYLGFTESKHDPELTQILLYDSNQYLKNLQKVILMMGMASIISKFSVEGASKLRMYVPLHLQIYLLNVSRFCQQPFD